VTRTWLSLPSNLQSTDLPRNWKTIDRRKSKITLILLTAVLSTTALAQKIKVIVRQDARGPGTTDQQALLVFLQSSDSPLPTSPLIARSRLRWIFHIRER
jgi:hypothetical protein